MNHKRSKRRGSTACGICKPGKKCRKSGKAKERWNAVSRGAKPYETEGEEEGA